jgi:hypothetical protein
MNAGTRPDPGRLPFRRIINASLQTCLDAIDNGQRTQPDGQLRIGRSRIRGPIKHDRDSGTHQVQVRLARGPLRPLLRMRLNIDRCSPSTTALELIPAGRIRPTAAYFHAGHLLLDTLARTLPQQSPAAHTLGSRAPTAGAVATGAGAPGGMGVTPAVAAGATRVESMISGRESLWDR